MRFDPATPETAFPWAHVPCDWRRPDASEATIAYFDPMRGFGQVLPRPSADQVAAYYRLDSYFTHHDVAADTAPPQAKPAGPCAGQMRLAARSGRRGGSRLVGAPAWPGTEARAGNWLRQRAHPANLAALGHHVTGVEPDPAARARAQAAGLDVLGGGAESLPAELADGKFDAILFMHVLEHCLDPTLALDNALTRLAPGGQLVIELPNSDCLGHTHFGPLWLWLDLPRHLNFFTARSLTALVQSRGLQVDTLDYVGYTRAS